MEIILNVNLLDRQAELYVPLESSNFKTSQCTNFRKSLCTLNGGFDLPMSEICSFISASVQALKLGFAKLLNHKHPAAAGYSRTVGSMAKESNTSCERANS
ncbi:hypothetical protein ATANTOWER_019439 [Ataeniobius toweri]|uniref:Uncharacterized protein n=1 Tax=Ataeniobius toweri TaxID=208326 RepID=A0ABU7BR35_9TELE|nr:hypothetical protein [Ataeniobius toweri]